MRLSQLTGLRMDQLHAEYEELMQVILSVRQACRDQKQWALADCIRDRLAEIGITIEDSPQGARWKKREV